MESFAILWLVGGRDSWYEVEKLLLYSSSDNESPQLQLNVIRRPDPSFNVGSGRTHRIPFLFNRLPVSNIIAKFSGPVHGIH